MSLPMERFRDHICCAIAFRQSREMLNTEGGLLLKQYRKEKGYSVRKFALAIGIDFTYLSKVENGKMPISTQLIYKIADFDKEQPYQETPVIASVCHGE